MYKHAVQGELPAASDYQTGIYWIDLTKDILASVKYRSKERHALSQYIEPYRNPYTCAIFDWKDPKPSLKRSLQVVKKSYQGVLPSKSGTENGHS